MGPAGVLLEGKAEGPMGGRQSAPAGLSKARAVRRWEGLSEGSEFSSNKRVLSTYCVQEPQNLN